jgi:hypothetical protein
MRNAYNILAGMPKGTGHSEDPDVQGTIILKWILRKSGAKM